MDRYLLLVLLLTATASAGSPGVPPPGTYSLGKDPRPHRWYVDGNELPSCGDEAKKLVESFKGLNIHYRQKVWVAGHVWVDDGVAGDRKQGYTHWIHDPDTSQDARIAFGFWRDQHGAQAMLLFWRLDANGAPTCNDGAMFHGTYAP